MTLESGAQLGPYRIVAPLGAGGMGEVYRALDTRLNRTVAVKLLPEHLSSSPERRKRFQREAKAISSLNHPKICTLHDVGEENGLQYLVLELLEGETLAQRISKGPFHVTEALTLAADIAEALDAAHSRGLIHRDLKPGNIMLTKTGLKLLDFGLARPFHDFSADLSEARTATSPLTAAGSVMGTLLYMAPEQIEAKQADARSDIFALGSVLYEMLTGKCAFGGESQNAIIAGILKEEPPPVRESVPSARIAERCLSRCLAKDPDERWQSARDLMYELRWLADKSHEPEETIATVDSVARRWPMMTIATSIALALTGGIVTGWALFRSGEPPGDFSVHAEVSLAEETHLNGWGSPVVAISDDGRSIAYVANGPDGSSGLYVRPLDSPETTKVPDSDTSEGPFFSPDGRWVGFAVGVSSSSRPGQLMKYSLETGITQPVCPLEDYFGADWLSDGDILFVNGLFDGLWKVSSDGGEPRNVLPAFKVNGDETPRPVGAPVALPGGRFVLLTDVGQFIGRLAVVDLTSGEYEDLGVRTMRGFIAGKDQLFYADQNGTLMRTLFDTDSRNLAGAGTAILTGLSMTRFGVPVLDMSNNGTLVYSQGFVRGSGIIPSEMVHIDSSGAETALPFEPQVILRGIMPSPSGDRLAASIRDGSIWIYDLDRGTRIKLPPPAEGVQPFSPRWSPDGEQVVFTALTEAGWSIFRQPVRGNMEPVLLHAEENAELSLAFLTSDHKGVIYTHESSIRLKSLEEGAAPRILVEGMGPLKSASVSPDGRWLAFSAGATGDFQVYVQDLSGSSGRLALSSDGGSFPRWSSDGGELYYYNSGRIMGISVPQSSTDHFGQPRTIVETDINPIFGVDPAGGFFGYRLVPDLGIQRKLQLITNWDGFGPPGSL